MYLADDGTYKDPEFTTEKAAFVKKIVEKNFIENGLVNLNLVWDVNPEDSDVRITFRKDEGAYSNIGIDSLHVPIKTPTMNLGWLDDQDDWDFSEAKNTGAVVVHEFGHMLGLIHEHSRSKSDTHIEWNKQLVYDTMWKSNGWDKATVDAQIFQAYDNDSYNGSVYDPDSIMHYYFDPNYFIPQRKLIHATKLSELDRETIAKKYPGGGGTSIISGGGEISPVVNPGGSTGTTPGDGNDDGKTSRIKKILKWAAVIVLVFIFFIVCVHFIL